MTRPTIGQIALVAVIIVGVSIVGLTRLSSSEQTDTETTTSTPANEETEQVTRRDLTQTEKADGTIGYGASRQLGIVSDGIVTQAPHEGDILQAGDVAMSVAGRPVVLVAGDTPMYRELRRVPPTELDDAGNKTGELHGNDVLQLQNYLLFAGFNDNGRLKADSTFGLTTERAVQKWQRFVGHSTTGRIDRSQMLFVDRPVRVETSPSVGDNFVDLTVFDTSPSVTLSVTKRNRSFFAVGTAVAVTIDGNSIDGKVTKAERTVGEDGQTSYSITVTLPPDAASSASDAAQVVSTKVIATDVLTVPVRALIALAEGGWAVQQADGDQQRLTAVELGEVVDGLAEITGVDEGTEVVVAT